MGALRLLTQMGGGEGFCTEYKAVYDLMTIKPTVSDKINQNKWLSEMKNKGYYSKEEILDFFCIHSVESQLNWASPSNYTPVLQGTPDFIPYQGFRGRVNNLVKLSFTPSINGTKISQNNICVIIGVGSNKAESIDDFGAFNGTARLSIRSRHPDNNVYTRVNSTETTGTSGNLDSIKYYAISRNNANSYDRYVNKSKTTITATSTGNLDKELYACGFNGNGVVEYSNKLVRFVFIFSYLTQSEINDIIDITESYLANYKTNLLNYTENNYITKPYPETKTPITLTTYDGSGQTVHPSVIDIGSEWNGYRYWMANTPYPNSDSQYENASIWASNDGVTWVVPNGLVNPVIPKPVNGFNADSSLYYDIDSNKLYMIYKYGYTYMTDSSDGVTWSMPYIVLSPHGESECLSPNIIKIADKYYIYYHSLTTFNGLIMKRVSCNTINGTYADREIINLPTSSARHRWWHSDIKYYNGNYWIVASEKSVHDSLDIQSEIYLMKSSDGINFVKNPYPTVYIQNSGESGGLYKPTLCIVEGQAIIYYSSRTTAGVWSISKINVDLL